MPRIFVLLILLSALSNLNAAENKAALEIVEDRCKHCHGLNGESSNVMYPRLAGQNKNYMIKQLHNFRSGKREGTMNDMAADLTDTEIDSLAAYFSTQPSQTHRVFDSELAAVGWYIYHRGNQYSEIPACASCHGENGEGTADLPRLAGQHKRYISSQLNDFHERKRTNDNAIMYSVTSKMTELEIEAVAIYVSGLK